MLLKTGKKSLRASRRKTTRVELIGGAHTTLGVQRAALDNKLHDEITDISSFDLRIAGAIRPNSALDRSAIDATIASDFNISYLLIRPPRLLLFN